MTFAFSLKSNKLFFFIIILCTGISPLNAQPDKIQFQRFSLENGLSSDSITDIVEDSLGYIWIGTTEGLNRFDGYQFQKYLHELDNPTSIPEQFVRQLFIDSNRHLWVVSNQGLARYIPEKDNFERFNTTNQRFENDRFFHIHELDTGVLIAASENHLYVFNQTSQRFNPLNYSGEELPSLITNIHQYDDRIIIGSISQGLFELSDNLTKLTKLNFPSLPQPPQSLYGVVTVNEHVWLATDVGVIVLNNDFSVHQKSTQRISTQRNINEALTILQRNDEEVWIGTNDGIDIINTIDYSVLSIHGENAMQVGLTPSIATKLYKDTNDSIWLGTYSEGLSQYNHQLTAIQHLQAKENSDYGLSDGMIWAIDEDHQKQIWIATQQNGLNKFDPASGKIRQFLTNFEFPIWDAVTDEDHRLWIASSNGVYLYQQTDTDLQMVKHYRAGENVESILITSNHLYFSANNGELHSIDLTSLALSSSRLDPSIFFLRPSLFDSHDRLWLNTNLGFITYEPEIGEFSRVFIQLEYNSVSYSGITETENAFWISTYEHGIIKVAKEDYQVLSHYTHQTGLSSNTVISMQVSDNFISVIGLKNIDLINQESGTIVKRLSEEDLKYASLNEGASFLSSEQQLFVGSTKGVFKLNIDTLGQPQNNTLSPPALRHLNVFNKRVQPDSEQGPLEKPIGESNTINLSHSDSPFTIEFAQLNPINPNGIDYRYRLIGNHENWLETSANTRQATYTNIGFGTFDFQVQSRYSTGPWSDSRHLTVRVAPPFWLHPYAILGYVLALSLIIFFAVKYTKERRNAVQRIRTSEERLKLTLWSSGDELWDWNIPQETIHRSNTWGIIDFPKDAVRSVVSSTTNNIHPADLKHVTEALQAHLDSATDHFEMSYRLLTHDNKWIWVLDRGKVVLRDNNDHPLRMTGTLKNIQHLKAAEEQLKLFKTSIENISDSVFITDDTFKLISVNSAYCKSTKETEEQALASYLTFHQYPDAFTEEIKKALFHRGAWSGELESRKVDGEKYEMDLNIDALYDDNDEITHFVGVFSDITARKATEKELIKLSNIDLLTNLPNRSFFQASLDSLVKRNAPHALICLDMDNFKKVNDSIGHEAGDQLIKLISVRLQSTLDRNTTCFRLGGDEFSIILEENMEPHEIASLSQHILKKMRLPLRINSQEFVLGCSIGIAFFPSDGMSSQELLKNADTAMYYAKNTGGNNYQFFSSDMNKDAVRQVQIENLIRRGLKEDLFTVYYQPKIEIATGKLVGMEALVRFEHPEKGLVPPNQFIGLAEKTGQISEIGLKVLHQACADTKKWIDKGLFDGQVAVNISARQFEELQLDRTVARILKNTGLPAHHLECEITETTLMQHPDHALKLMTLLREQGVQLALDDFGTGYSSLAYLKKFPLNTLKIDKAFIDDIATSVSDQHMLSSIIDIAHNLGLKVVAEGVESEEQLSILHRHKCEMLQGYLYSKPLHVDRFEKLLIENEKLSKVTQLGDVKSK